MHAPVVSMANYKLIRYRYIHSYENNHQTCSWQSFVPYIHTLLYIIYMATFSLPYIRSRKNGKVNTIKLAVANSCSSGF